MTYRWNAEYCENRSRLRAFIPMTGSRSVQMSLPEQLELSSIAGRLILGDSIRLWTNGVSLFYHIASVAPLNKTQTTS